MTDQFPSNSDKSKAQTEPKQVSRVVQGEAIRRKKGLGKQFRGTFFGGDGRTAMQYMLFEVLVPAAKDALVDAGAQGIERLIYGESRRKPGPRAPMGMGAAGHVQYNRFAPGSNTPSPMASYPSLSRRARAAHDFDEIILETRAEANEVIDSLYEIVSRHDAATVADLYALVGLKSSHTDHKWGWDDLRGAGISRAGREGYMLNLPDPEVLG